MILCGQRALKDASSSAHSSCLLCGLCVQIDERLQLTLAAAEEEKAYATMNEAEHLEKEQCYLRDTRRQQEAAGKVKASLDAQVSGHRCGEGRMCVWGGGGGQQAVAPNTPACWPSVCQRLCSVLAECAQACHSLVHPAITTRCATYQSAALLRLRVRPRRWRP